MNLPDAEETEARSTSDGPFHPEAVEQCYRLEGARLWRAILLYSGDRDVAADAVAEAFAQALGRGEAIRDLRRWVWRAAFAIARGELPRRFRSSHEVPDQPMDMPPMTVDLVRALTHLSAKQRAALVLHHCAGYSNRETAEIIGSTTAAVRVHLERGRRRMRQMLEDDDA